MFLLKSIKALAKHHVTKVPYVAAAALIFGSVLAPIAQAQAIIFGASSQLSDNVIGTGSPTIIWFNNEPVMYYVNHGSSPNLIYADLGLTGRPQSTGIQADSVGPYMLAAAVLNGKVLLAYPNSSGQWMSALSGNGVNFSNFVNLGATLGAGGIGGAITIANTVQLIGLGPGNTVYTFTTSDGLNYSSYNTLHLGSTSPPSIALFNGIPYMAIIWYDTSGRRVVYVGPTTATTSNTIPNIYWGNSNSGGIYPGVALVAYGGYLYVFGQNTASSQNLIYTYWNGSSWSGAVGTNIQMRWEPTLLATPTNQVWLAYQDDNNTNISYAHN